MNVRIYPAHASLLSRSKLWTDIGQKKLSITTCAIVVFLLNLYSFFVKVQWVNFTKTEEITSVYVNICKNKCIHSLNDVNLLQLGINCSVIIEIFVVIQFASPSHTNLTVTKSPDLCDWQGNVPWNRQMGLKWSLCLLTELPHKIYRRKY